MIVPHDVDTQSVQSHAFDHKDPMLPILDWDSGIMYLSGVYFR